jgi:hypothetical protein
VVIDNASTDDVTEFSFDGEVASSNPATTNETSTPFDLEKGLADEAVEDSSDFAFEPKIPAAMVAVIASTSSAPLEPVVEPIETEPEPFAIEFNFEDALLKPVEFNLQLAASENDMLEAFDFDFDRNFETPVAVVPAPAQAESQLPVAAPVVASVTPGFESEINPERAATTLVATAHPVASPVSSEPELLTSLPDAADFDLEKPQPVTKVSEDFEFEPNIPAAMVAVIAATVQPLATVTNGNGATAGAKQKSDREFDLDTPPDLVVTAESSEFAFEPNIPAAMVAVIASTAREPREKI